MPVIGRCFSCGTELTFETASVGRREECPNCKADVRVCYNCEHYDAKSYNECREPQADRIVEKDKSNFCDYYRFGNAASAKGANTKADAMKKLDDLFK